MNALQETTAPLKVFDKEKHHLKNEMMDTLHQEFLDIYNSANPKNIQSIRETLTLLLAHSRNHFAQEEASMDTYGYPTSREHKEEHAKVLAEMQYFLDLSHSPFGQRMLKAYCMEKVPLWFDLHLLTMDSDLAYFLKTAQ